MNEMSSEFIPYTVKIFFGQTSVWSREPLKYFKEPQSRLAVKEYTIRKSEISTYHERLQNSKDLCLKNVVVVIQPVRNKQSRAVHVEISYHSTWSVMAISSRLANQLNLIT